MPILKSKENDIWILHDIELDKTRIYNIFTKAGKYRWGKIYSEDKYFTLLSWQAEVTTLENGEDINRIYNPWEIVKIRANIANIFYFPVDTEMLEWFSTRAKPTDYERSDNLKKSWK